MRSRAQTQCERTSSGPRDVRERRSLDIRARRTAPVARSTTSFLAPRPWVLCLFILLFGFALPGAARAEDLIEFLSGAKLTGEVGSIDKTARTVTFNAQVAGQTLSRTYPYDKIHAVTMNGKRYVINEKSTTTPADTSTRGKATGKEKTSPADGAAGSSGSTRLRSRAEIEKFVEEVGRQPPDWFESTPLDYPKTLDMTWPEKPPGGWNNQLNVGQYVWDIINPNPSRWRSGIRLMHHLLSQHQSDSAKRTRAMHEIGAMYFRFFQDYGRAAFWWRKAGVAPGENHSIQLAECYWRLGNKQMAIEMLTSRSIRSDVVKLWGDIGETKKALELADQIAPQMVKQGFSAGPVYLHAGDACRLVGRYAEALKYYQKVLDETGDLKGKVDQARKRAAANIEAIRLFELSDVSKVADGAYRAKSMGYEGDVEVEVRVAGRRIEEVRVTQHKEKQFYSALTDIPTKIVAKQSVKGVDATSGATITAEAIINATAKALADGAKK